MCLCSKQSSLFSFYALPSGGKSKDAVVHCQSLDSNLGPRVLEAINVPIVSQPLSNIAHFNCPFYVSFPTKNKELQNEWMRFELWISLIRNNCSSNYATALPSYDDRMLLSMMKWCLVSFFEFLSIPIHSVPNQFHLCTCCFVFVRRYLPV